MENKKLSDLHKSKIIADFTPVVSLHHLERDFPVKPESVINNSALWASKAPHDSKINWGIGSSSFRSPIIPKGNIPINTFSSYSFPSYKVDWSFKEVWLESSGWDKSNSVDISTDNRVCSEIADRNVYLKNIDGPWFYAEIVDSYSLSEFFDSKTVIEQVGLNHNEFEETLGEIVILCFYFLFPNHIENTHIARADGSIEPSANFEGDWACYSVILKEEDKQFNPVLAGFSRSRRGASSDFGGDFTQQYMELFPWEQVKKIENHVGILISLGTHNIYPMDSNNSSSGGIKPQWVDMGKGLSEPINKFVTESVENPAAKASAAVVLAKVAAGFGIFGPVGAIGGLIAGIAEAVAIHDAVHHEPELEFNPDARPEEGDFEDPKDEFEEHSDLSHVIVPADKQELASMFGNNFNSSNIYIWMGTDLEKVVDRQKQLFWSGFLNYVEVESPVSRWGVRCSDDMFNRRAGGKFPDYRLQILKRMVEFL